ncbi:(4Fe-4S)-binding protein [Fulvivirgaceae bacterium BMA10]|uniref:(4Fe-4S)-binding protein n=1 Tax=Splendidivirga corallicola TaxID=3051826 RepID=A0ABT8KJJ6_9BACT|nr:(4Fe-4S)-binding protein [Fulvivirgaceae bacterium BMA10]
MDKQLSGKMEKEIRKEYSNGEVTVIWQPHLCIHSGICVKGLASVFQPKEKPWIKMDGASTQAIIDQVKQCPSGALSCKK